MFIFSCFYWLTYVHPYTYIYKCIYIRSYVTHIHICIYIYICIYSYLCKYAYAYLYIYIHICTSTRIQVVLARVCVAGSIHFKGLWRPSKSQHPLFRRTKRNSRHASTYKRASQVWDSERVSQEYSKRNIDMPPYTKGHPKIRRGRLKSTHDVATVDIEDLTHKRASQARASQKSRKRADRCRNNPPTRNGILRGFPYFVWPWGSNSPSQLWGVQWEHIYIYIYIYSI